MENQSKDVVIFEEATSIKEDVKLPEVKDFNPNKAKHNLAQNTLLTVAIIFFLAGVSAVFGGEKGKDVFDTCATVLPPIATLILGYFFSKK